MDASSRRKGIIKSKSQATCGLPANMDSAIKKVLSAPRIRRVCRITLAGLGKEEQVKEQIVSLLEERGGPDAEKIVERDKNGTFPFLKPPEAALFIDTLKEGVENSFYLRGGELTVNMLRRALGLREETAVPIKKLLTDKRALIVDPDEANTTRIYNTLAAHGAETVRTSDTKSFFRRYGEKRPDVIILNVDLPSMKCAEALEWLKDMFGDSNLAPAIVLAPEGAEEDANAALKAGAAAKMKTPIVPQELIDKIMSCI